MHLQQLRRPKTPTWNPKKRWNHRLFQYGNGPDITHGYKWLRKAPLTSGCFGPKVFWITASIDLFRNHPLHLPCAKQGEGVPGNVSMFEHIVNLKISFLALGLHMDPVKCRMRFVQMCQLGICVSWGMVSSVSVKMVISHSYPNWFTIHSPMNPFVGGSSHLLSYFTRVVRC